MSAEAALVEPSRALRLRNGTHATHETLDKRIMSADPFGNLDRYAAFLKVQHALHGRVERLYLDPQLGALLPGLASRRRLDRVCRDVEDITGKLPSPVSEVDEPLDVPTALGWLYVVEGSNLGAAILLKTATKTLGLSEAYGARHLAGHADGRGLHWRNFTSALDAIALTPEEDERAVEGARQAFAFVLDLVEREMPHV
ncbi:biliverdin-producing heme oxygenase [Rhizobium cremeum]|uniref:biliverdin-producing heme oxygenase n=1 Tax=Rhizobium cremeum TaxID=2813827 RepID=UPI000DE3604B